MVPRHRPASPAWLLFLLVAGCAANGAPAVTLPLTDGVHIPGPIRLTDSAGARYMAPEGALTRGGMVIFVRDGKRVDSIPARSVTRVEHRQGMSGGGGLALMALAFLIALGIMFSQMDLGLGSG